jgi:hypothetical protein
MVFQILDNKNGAPYFCSTLWLVTKGIVRFFRFYIPITPLACQSPFKPFFPLQQIRLYILTLDPFIAFHLGFFLLQIYIHIPFVLS